MAPTPTMRNLSESHDFGWKGCGFGVWGTIGLYRDNGKENGNYYSGV